MRTMIEMAFTAGDRLRPLRAILENPDGSLVDLTGNAVSFKMVKASDGTVKVNYEPAVIEGDPTAGMVRYDWLPPDVTPAGDYYGWFRRTVGGLNEHFPAGGRVLRIRFADPA
jgi:hypothetical protein